MIAKFHARAIADLDDAKLVACYNRTAPKAEALAAEFGGEVYTDLEQMLARDDLDIVTICTASGAHCEPAVAAARAGKHVIVEKPLDVTREHCQAMIDACAGGCQTGYDFSVSLPPRQPADETSGRTRAVR